MRRIGLECSCDCFFLPTEIPLLLMFFVMVFLSGVGAYVHLYVREVYTFGIFVTLEFFQVSSYDDSTPHTNNLLTSSLNLPLMLCSATFPMLF